MNFNLFDFSYLSVIIKIVLVVIIYLIIFQALKIMNKDIRRGRLKGEKDLGWRLKVECSNDSSSLLEEDIISIGNKLSIGRNRENQLILTSPAVSNYHAKIYFEDGRYILEDNSSTNGTFVNGIKIDKKFLQPGDKIRISETVFTVSDDL